MLKTCRHKVVNILWGKNKSKIKKTSQIVCAGFVFPCQSANKFYCYNKY